MFKKYYSPLVTLLLLAGVLAGCSTDGPVQAQPSGQQPPTEVVTGTVQRKPVQVHAEYPAQLKALETADIRSRVEGTLLNYTFREGGVVLKGQVLFQIDPRPYEATVATARGQLSQANGRLISSQGRLAQARAQLRRAQTQVNLEQVNDEVARSKANLEAARREVERYRPLVGQGAIPGQRFDEVKDQYEVARAEYETVTARYKNTRVSDRAEVGVAQADVQSAQADVIAAQAAVQTAQAELQAAELNLSYCVIRAPFGGVIGTLGVDPGSLIIPGQTRLATLSRNAAIYADFPVSETEYLKLSRDDRFQDNNYTLRLADGTEYPETGEFVLVDRELNQDTGTLTVRARFPNASGLLKPGGFGRVQMLTEELADAVVIPQKALTSLQSLDAVFVVGPDNKVEQRQITLGPRLEDEIVVTEGLKPGEKLVVEGLQKVRPGVTVKDSGAA